MRKIIHLDMDCFYAAVEMREQPELAQRPIAVGGGSRRGVICTANYVARKFGVRSAMPGFLAREKCPDLIFLPVRFDLYRAESAKIRALMHQVTPWVEPLSLDEAYLDVTEVAEREKRFAWDIAKELRRRILETTGLTASAGIAPNKMLAKVASAWRKPNGQFAIRPEEVATFMHQLPVQKLWGVGPKSAAKFAEQKILTCGDLQALSQQELIQRSGKWGQELYHLCRGDDSRPVNPHRIRKSLSTETTFIDLLTRATDCAHALDPLVEELLHDLARKGENQPIHKAFVKVKFSDFSSTSKEKVCAAPNRADFHELLHAAKVRKELPVRLIGCGVRFYDEDALRPSRGLCCSPFEQPELDLV